MLTRILVVTWCFCMPQSVWPQPETFTETVLSTGLNYPWEITYGPDNKLWVTESRGYKVQRVDPFTGLKEQLLDLSSLAPPGTPQGGMMGLAIHPDFFRGKPFFYIAYVYAYNYSLPGNGGSFFSTRISRFTCNLSAPSGLSLKEGSEVIIRDALPGSNDHNSGRLAINKSEHKLYYTIGDMGAGQFNNTDRVNNAQNVNVLEGKVLRFNLEPDNSQTGEVAWIPVDNPFLNAGIRSPVYSYGHRNAQGLVWASFANGQAKLYSSEHSDRTDDEINEILAGKNYMWPRVSGFCDGNYNGLTLASKPANETDNSITDPPPFCDGSANIKEPLAVLFYLDRAGIQALGPGSESWPTIAPSSIDFYGNANGIQGWYPSLLIPSLKKGVIYRIKLNTDGSMPVDSYGQPNAIPYFKTNSSGASLNRRWRDVCISPDGRTIFACTDNGDNVSNPGSILKFIYTGAPPCSCNCCN